MEHGHIKHPQTQGACESCHKEIKKHIYNNYLDSNVEFNILKSLRETTNTHNNKKHSTTNEIPSEIRDLTELNIIKDRMKNVISRVNKNIDSINYDGIYVFNSDLLIKNNEIFKNNKKIKNNLILKVPVFILSEANKESEVLIEITKTVEKFKFGESYYKCGFIRNY